MVDIHDIISFSCEGERILGVVIEHYNSPLDDFYVVYADYTIFKSISTDEDASIIISNVIIPACDEALFEFKLKRQHLRDMNRCHDEIDAFKEALKDRMILDDTL